MILHYTLMLLLLYAVHFVRCYAGRFIEDMYVEDMGFLYICFFTTVISCDVSSVVHISVLRAIYRPSGCFFKVNTMTRMKIDRLNYIPYTFRNFIMYISPIGRDHGRGIVIQTGEDISSKGYDFPISNPLSRVL